MKTKQTIVYGFLAVVLALALTGCPNGDDNNDGSQTGQTDNGANPSGGTNPNGGVTKTDPTVTWPAGLTALYGQSLSAISLASYTNSGGTPGAFSWTTPASSVGALGARSHNITFTPTDTANYNTAAKDVDLAVRLLEMVNVAGGSFQMGKNGDGTTNNVEPVHTVTLAGFNMGKYEVTQKQYEVVMGKTIQQQNEISDYQGLDGVGDNYPMYHVNWYDAIEFCNALSVLEGLTPYYTINKTTSDPNNTNSSDTIKWLVTTNASANGYRLPTEAQWEYASKGGASASDPYKIYSGSDTVGDVAWYSGNNGSSGDPDYGAKEVGTKAANELGIYDMSGNVFEWCWDWYAAYEDTAQTDPVGASSGSLRVTRGGGWGYPAVLARSAYRIYVNPGDRFILLGFRVLRP